MREIKESHRSQIKRADPRIPELFRNVRRAIDILEDMALNQHNVSPTPEPQRTPASDPPRPAHESPEKLAYTIKEARQAVGIGRTRIYVAMKNQELRAKKHGQTTLILASDLRNWLETMKTR
jgi:excisionase family DNA binding protein